MVKFAIYNPISFLATPPPLTHEAWRCDKQMLFADDIIDVVMYADDTEDYSDEQLITIFNVDDNKYLYWYEPVSATKGNGGYYYLFKIILNDFIGIASKDIYFRVITHYNGEFYSPICHISSDVDVLENTVKLQAYNTHNNNGIYNFQNNKQAISNFILPAGVQSYPEVAANNDFYEMSYGRNYPLNTENYLTYEFNFGGKFGLSPHVANAVYTLLCCEVVMINGERCYLRELPELQHAENYHRVTVRAKMIKETATDLTDFGNVFQPLPDLPRIPIGKSFTYLNTESGDFLITESSDNIITGSGK
jgi:hypothetical protein